MAPKEKDIKHDTDIHLLLERGRRIVVKSPGRSWEAVYWGEDEGGDIVACRMGQHWQFVHFNVLQFAESLVVQDLLPLSEIQAIENDVVKALGVRPD
jgi:hypothetical protein